MAILTGGGDCHGLNPCLYGATVTAENLGIELVGLRNGWTGAIDYLEVPLYEHELRQYIGIAGTFIGTSRVNPFKEDNDRSQKVVDNLIKNKIDGLVAVGGNDTLTVALKLLKKYPNIVGVTKTMDYDLQPYSLGFNSAVENARDFIEKLHTTAYSHDRIIFCELMGRKVGWVTLKAAVTAGADVAIIPEVKFDKYPVCDAVQKAIEERKANSRLKKGYAIVVIAEGINFGESFNEKMDEFGNRELKGVGERIANEIEDTLRHEYNLSVETKYVRPEHSIRGGRSSWFDIDMGIKYGSAAVQYAKEGGFGIAPTVDMKTEIIEPMKIEDVIKPKKVPDYLIKFYGKMVSFGV
jgi:6-phosphofructokinase 1